MNMSNVQLQRSVKAFYRDMDAIRQKRIISEMGKVTTKTRRTKKYRLVNSLDEICLSGRQSDVLEWVKVMSSRKSIAIKMGISIKTLEDHLLAMRKKMHCGTVQAMFDLVQAGQLLALS